MKILVIGSEGNIGRRLVPQLRSEGHVVFCCDQIQDYRPNYKVVNIVNSGDLTSMFYMIQPDVVYLLAAMVSRVTCEDSPHVTVNTNLGGLNNVIQLCKRYTSKLIYFSTSEVYGNLEGSLPESRICQPNNLYGVTKLMGEQLVQYEATNGLKYLILRPFMFYDADENIGDNRSAMIRFVSDLHQKKKITVHIGAKRSWLYMTDAVKIITKVSGYSNLTINIGSDKVKSMKRIARYICNQFDLDYKSYVEESVLPDRMTLTKIPDLKLCKELAGTVEPMIPLKKGVRLIIKRIKGE